MEKKQNEEKPKRTRQPRTPEIGVGAEVNMCKAEDGTFHFYVGFTTTVDASNYVPIGEIDVPKGYALIINGTNYGMSHKLIIPEQVIVGKQYVHIPCINFSPNLRRVYSGEFIATGILVKLADNATVTKAARDTSVRSISLN